MRNKIRKNEISKLLCFEEFLISILFNRLDFRFFSFLMVEVSATSKNFSQ